MQSYNATIKRKSLEKYIVVDKSETSIDASMDVPRKVGEAVLSCLTKLSRKEKGTQSNVLYLANPNNGSKIFFTISFSESSRVQIKSSYCPQKWVSGQNVFPVVGLAGALIMPVANTVKLPFIQLAKELYAQGHTEVAKWIKHNIKTIRWTRLDIATYTGNLDNAEAILDFLTGICGRVERAKSVALGVAESLGFKFKDYVSKSTGKPCGITFYKQVNETNIYSISIYRKDLEVMDRDSEGKAGELEKDSIRLVENRLRIEGHIFPPVFYRGKARKFKEIFLGENLEKQGKNAAVDIQKYFGSVEFLQDSEADTDTLRQCLKEMADQIGLPIIFGARHPVEVRRSVGEMEATEEERRILDLWLDNKVPEPDEGMSKAKFYRLVNGLTDRLGFRLLDVPFDAFLWIRMSLLQSMFTREEHRELNLLSLIPGKKNRIYELRSEASARADATLSSLKLTAKSLAVLGGENYGK